MQFNSFEYIFLLLPLSIIVYFLGNQLHKTVGKWSLIVVGVIFYTSFHWRIFLVLGISLLINYCFALALERTNRRYRALLLVPIIVNIVLLLYFKYTNFFIENVNSLLGKEIALKELVLPLGISFFTFQQIAYIVAVYKKEIDHNSIVDYLTYILFFPKLLMGPLVDPVDFINQINDENLKKVSVSNLACGIKIFCFGLFKKVMIADIFQDAVSWGFSNMEVATSMDWFLISLFYTFEIYFDFSGYSDMAVGSSMMMNITLPINFDSPYKAVSIRDFWKRWHISLTRFFTKYIYIPLGGSKKSLIITALNTMVVFLISGIWHGANWTFILWGVLYGTFMIFDRIFEKCELNIFEPVRWMVTFGLVNAMWLLFRADSILQWKQLIQTIIYMQDTTVSSGLKNCFNLPESLFIQNIFHLQSFTENIRGFWMVLYVLCAFSICLIPENNYKKMKQLSVTSALLTSVVFVWAIICLGQESVFVYFNF